MADGLIDIRMFVAAYEEGTFTAAAARENATQSGVSQHIGQLERSLGVRLFNRSKGGVSPTPAANSFYSHCVELLRAHHGAFRAAREFGHGLSGEVTIGLMPTLTQAALAPTLDRFATEHPNVRILVVEGYSALLSARLAAGELDLAITPAASGHGGMYTRHFANVPEVLIGMPGTAESEGKPVALRDLPPLKLVVPSAQNIRRQKIESYCVAHGGRIDRLLELDSVSGTLDLCSQSEWRSILPLPTVVNRVDKARLAVNLIVSPGFDLEMAMMAPSTRNISPAAERFRDMLAETVETMTTAWLAENDGREGLRS